MESSRKSIMTLINEKAEVSKNSLVGPKLYVMRLSAPLIARSVEPGQFVHMKVPHLDAHILRRPFSVYARDSTSGTLDILYQVVGAATEFMTTMNPGNSAELIGAIGKAWQFPSQTKRALLVGGGVGAAPLYMLCESLLNAHVNVDVILGAQCKDALVCKERFRELLNTEPRCSTDDGSYGAQGFCTTLAEDALVEAKAQRDPYDYVAVCGPHPLMRFVANAALEEEIYCEVSLERRMACGIGACLSCAVDTHSGKKRVCVDGPVFDAREIIW